MNSHVDENQIDNSHGSAARLTTLVPPSDWLRGYRWSWLSRDAIAGVTLAAYAIPISLAYASLAGLPPHYGIYCYLTGGLAYACLGSSRQLAIGPTSAIAMLVGTTVAGMAEGDPVRWAAIASLTALLVAAFGALAWCLRLSGLVSFISETILVGFKAGAALTIALTQMPKLLGVPGGGEHFFERLWILVGQLSDTNLTVLGMGLAAVVLLVWGERLAPGRPAALVVVVLSIGLVSLVPAVGREVTVVGDIPAGLPHLTWPSWRARDVDGVLPLAAACFLLAYVEGVAAARTLAENHSYRINPRQELLALGAANLATAVSQGFPVAGGLSQSVVNDRAGAQTPLALVVASATIGVCLLFLTGLLHNLPNVILAAIVLVAVSGLLDLRALRHLWRVSHREFGISLAALGGVLLLGILRGVLLAVVVSLLMLIAAAAKPHVAFLGRIPGTRRYSDLERHPDNQLIHGALIVRVESSLFYFNVEHVRDVIGKRLRECPEVRLIVCDLSASPSVDLAGADMLRTLCRDLAPRGIQVRIVDAHAQVRDLLRAEGLEEQVGNFDRRLSIDQIVTEFETAQPSI